MCARPASNAQALGLSVEGLRQPSSSSTQKVPRLHRAFAAASRAGVMRALAAGLARLPRQARSYAAVAELATQEDSPFLRFGNPEPQTFNHLQALGQIPETKVTTLSNGLRVASETTPFAETASVGVWIDAGSRYETDDNNGAAHFLEHMAFKGTKSRTLQQLEEQIENIGGHLNAFTTREMTCYFAKVFKKDVPLAVDILSDILQDSNMDESSVQRERNVILREMQEVEGMPDEVIFDHLHATAFQYSPLGRTILGPASNIKKLTRKDLADYIATHYTTPRMVVAGAGAIDHEQLVQLAGKAFGSLPNSNVSASDLVEQNPAIFTGSEVRINDPDLDTVQLAVAFRGAGWTDPDCVPLMVMQTILGSWDKTVGAGKNVASPLGQLFSANSLGESYMAFNTTYHDTGLFGIYATSPKGPHLTDLAWAIMREISKMSYNVSNADILRARNQLKASLLFSQDNTSGVCEDIGRQMLAYGRRIPKAEMFARIDAVDANAIKGVADRFIYDQDIAMASMGDLTFLPDYTYFRRRTYWLRY